MAALSDGRMIGDVMKRFLLLASCLIASSGVLCAPDEALLGKASGYPVGNARNWFFDESVRVGSFSHLDKILSHNVLTASPAPFVLKQAAAEPALRYTFKGQRYSIDDYLEHQRVTGLLIIKDGEILVERYQYDRKPGDRLLDDTIATYVPELRNSAYGETRIRNLLRMSSGVRFSEEYDGKDDLSKFAGLLARKGSVAALKEFNDREAAEGERFHYASIETQVLAATLRAATGKNLSQYLGEKLWQPMGAESDATWITTPDGLERAGGNFSATLRDWGRLGVLLANDGQVRLLRPDGTELDFTITGVGGFVHMSDQCVQVITDSGMWALDIQPGHEQMFLLPGVSR